MKFNKAQAMDVNQLDMVAGGGRFRIKPEVQDKIIDGVKNVGKKVKNVFDKLFR